MPLNVLVVDDSAVMRTMLTRTLRAIGLDLDIIVEAGNGADGLRVLQQRPIDLVLVDLNMPVMGGDEMLEHIRASAATRHLPVIVVTTERSETRVAAMRQLGAGFISKPFSAEQIRECVLGVLEGASAP
jgi:two-component system chemotaxis response regulator CheY